LIRLKIKLMKTILLSITLFVTSFASAQTLSDDFKAVLKHDNVERIKVLLENADKDACYETGNSTYTLLTIAIKVGANNCLNYLISQKANVEKACSSKTPLMYAAKYGNLAAAKALIKAGAKASTANKNGRTALDYASKYEQKELKTYLESL